MEVSMVEKILILKKSLEVFGEKGFYLATIEEIAIRSNLRETVISKYFKNKEALFIELLNMASVVRKQEVFENIGLTEDVKEKLSRFIISALRFARNHKNYYRILTASVGAAYPEVQNKLSEVRKEFHDRVYQILQDGVRQGKFRTVNPLIATAFLGKLIEGTIDIVEAKLGYAIDQMILSMLDLIWNGLACEVDPSNSVSRNEQLINK
jgi:TetR/AcrR family fatty acid metabolism transcriptional regulator